MLQTPLCSLLGIRAPIIQGALGGPWPPSVRLAVAVSEAGALGSLPTALRSVEQVREDIAALRALTDRPFALNHTMKPFLEDVFAEMVRAAPSVVSFALGSRPISLSGCTTPEPCFFSRCTALPRRPRRPKVGRM